MRSHGEDKRIGAHLSLIVNTAFVRPLKEINLRAKANFYSLARAKYLGKDFNFPK